MIYEDFYKNGFAFIENFDSLDLNNTLRELTEGKVKAGFSLQQKYSSTLDLRPNVIDYSPDFLDVLKKNEIKNFLRKSTLREITLFHIQARVAESTTSYMDWHRDSYYDGQKRVGMTPPGYKIIYYPDFDGTSPERLEIIPGSHRLMLDVRSEDLKLVNRFPRLTIKANNNRALLFDTSLLHAVVPDRPKETSVRLIYSFVSKEQIVDGNFEDLHVKTSENYERLT
jgi:hypothetical protein